MSEPTVLLQSSHVCDEQVLSDSVAALISTVILFASEMVLVVMLEQMFDDMVLFDGLLFSLPAFTKCNRINCSQTNRISK